MKGVAALALGALTACGAATSHVPEGDADGGSPPPPSFCFTRPKLQFCEDFDAQPLPAGFDGLIEEGGQWSVDEADATSLPRAALVTATGAGARVLLRKAFAPAEAYKTFLQFRVDASPASGEAELLAVELSPTARLTLKTNASDDAWLSVNGDRLGETKLPRGEWVSVRLDVLRAGEDAGPGGRLVTLKLGEEAVLSRHPLPSAGLEAPAVQVGLWVDGEAGWSVRYDTVTVITQ